ncbi:RNA-binding protein MRN1 [Pseudocercospora fuligena]|uniref:RNA-binding protein MRN1 n=1 Tax=Pseudocercospora fuligena TaxID=685502 RepID=A0A8H6RB70_9PEZI|nr:RNA-binding protein MRN1 [Pseudocercospora fuligena]
MARKHTSAQILGRQDAASVTISKAEYDSLLRDSRDFQLLKQSLFQGGLTAESLALLINGPNEPKPTQPKINSWADEYNDTPPAYGNHTTNHTAPRNGAAWRSGASAPSFSAPSGSGNFHRESRQPLSAEQRATDARRHVSNGVPPSSLPDNADFDEADSFMDEHNDVEATHSTHGAPLRTLYLSGFAANTTYRDLLTVIKGGKLLNINMRSERSATVTFADGAADFLTWVKRYDIYLHSKRIDFKWADRQYHLNNHIQNKLANGATRNILIRSAVEKGFTEAQIRADMEHIHNLIVIDVAFKAGNAYVATNSVHNALFARTCMMSRTAYRGCKIEFFPDECDVPLPAHATVTKPTSQEPIRKKMSLSNRFDMLNVDGGSVGSNEENCEPHDSAQSDNDEDEDDTVDIRTPHGVSLRFLDDDGAN